MRSPRIGPLALELRTRAKSRHAHRVRCSQCGNQQRHTHTHTQSRTATTSWGPLYGWYTHTHTMCSHSRGALVHVHDKLQYGKIDLRARVIASLDPTHIRAHAHHPTHPQRAIIILIGDYSEPRPRERKRVENVCWRLCVCRAYSLCG